VKRDEKEGYTALQLGCGAKRVKQITGTELGHFRANGVPIKRKLQEFRVTEVRTFRSLYHVYSRLCWKSGCPCILWCCTDGIVRICRRGCCRWARR